MSRDPKRGPRLTQFSPRSLGLNSLASRPVGGHWRNIPISLIDLEKGEWRAQACEITVSDSWLLNRCIGR